MSFVAPTASIQMCVCARARVKNSPSTTNKEIGYQERLWVIRLWKQANPSILYCFDDIATSSRRQLVPEEPVAMLTAVTWDQHDGI